MIPHLIPHLPPNPKKPAPVRCGAPLQQFWDMFTGPEPEPSRRNKAFRLCVVVDGRQGPLHPRYEFVRDMGMPHLLNILRGIGKLPDGDLSFVFPDRWLTPGQALQFVYLLKRHPSIVSDKARRTVLIITCQPYIVSDCSREEVRVIQSPPAGDPMGLMELEVGR